MHRTVMPCLALALLAGCAGFGTPASLDDVTEVTEVTLAEEEAAMVAPADEPGFFARFFNRSPATPESATPESPADNETTVETASASPGFFGRLLSGSSDTDASTDAPPKPGTVPPLTNQPFGEVGTTCGLSTREMGTNIADVSGYKIYDTAPNTTGPRPHYITGFKDRCARQFTAALVLTGDVGTHEVVRYETAQSRRPYTQVDNAYEAIKSGFCRAGFGKPCGSRINALARNTTFITGYERFTSSPVWMEILLHGGEVAAVAVERK